MFDFVKTSAVEHELLLCVYMCMAGGVPSFAYASFSSTIKQRHGYDPSEINLIGSFMQAGVWTAVLGGIVLDKYGNVACCLASLILGGTGWSLLYVFTASDEYEGINWGAYAAAAYCVGQGCAYLYITALKVCQTNTPVSMRGRVVSILSTWVSLAAGIYSILGTTLVSGTNFFLLLLGAHVTQCLLGMSLRMDIPEENFRRDRLRSVLRVMTAISLATAIVIFVSGLAGDSTYTAYLTAACLSGPVVLLCYTHFFSGDVCGGDDTDLVVKESRRSTRDVLSVAETEDSDAVREGEKEHLVTPIAPKAKRERIDFVAAFWLLAGYFFFFGPAAAALNTFAMLVMSRAGLTQGHTYIKTVEDVPHDRFRVTLITTFSVFNTVGRIATGFGVDASRGRIALPGWLTLWAAVVSFGLLLLSLDTQWVGMACAVGVFGLGVGGCQATVPRLASDIFGLKYFAVGLSCLACAPSTGTLLFGHIYAELEQDREDTDFAYIQKDNNTAPVKYCIGNDCLGLAFKIGSISALFGMCVIAGLWWRPVCKKPEPYDDISDDEEEHEEEEEGEEEEHTVAAKDIQYID